MTRKSKKFRRLAYFLVFVCKTVLMEEDGPWEGLLGYVGKRRGPIVKPVEGFDVDHVPDVNAVGIRKDPTRDTTGAKVLKHKIGLAEVVVATIAATNNNAGQPRPLRRVKSVLGILDGESLLRGAAELREGERIDLGVRLFSGHILASDHESNAGEAIPAEKSLKQGFNP